MSKLSKSSLANRALSGSDVTHRFSQLIQSHILDPGADLLSRRGIRSRKDGIEIGAKSLSIALLLASATVAPEFLGIGLGGKITLALWGSLISWIGERWKQDAESQQRVIEVATAARALHRGEVVDAIAFSQAETLRNALPYRQRQDDRLLTVAETLATALEAIEGIEARIEGMPALSSAQPARFKWSGLQNPDQHPHILILGASGDGKTWIGEWIADLLGQGNDLKVITTKRKRDQWRGMPCVGVGRNFEAIEAEFAELLSEMTRRCSDLDSVDSLPQIIRPIDELPAIAENIEGEKDPKTGKPKGLSTYTKPLILEARETRIRLILHAQGKQVRLLGFEGISDCLDSLTIVRLGKMAIEHAEGLLKRKLITDSDFEWIRNQPRPVTVGDELAEYPRPDNWHPTNRYISVSNCKENSKYGDIFGVFRDSSHTGTAEDCQSDGEDSQAEAEDTGKTDGKGAEDSFTLFSAILDNPPDSPIFDTLTPEGRLLALRIMLFRNIGTQDIIRLAWGHRSSGRNYHLYQAARAMLDKMIEALNEQGFSNENSWGFPQ
jgi:hypothetical protein